MKRWLFEDFGLKVSAVLIAFVLWAYVDLKQVLERKHLLLHFEVTDIPSGMALDPNTKTTVSVMLIGKDVKDLEPDDLEATASLKGFPAGQQEIMVHPKIEDLPLGVTASVHDVKIDLTPLGAPRDVPKKKYGK